MFKALQNTFYNIQDKLFYSEIKFQIIEFSALAKYDENNYMHNFGMKNMHQF